MSGGSPAAPIRFSLVDAGLLVTVSLVWGAAYVFIRQGIVLGASPLAFAAVRYLLSAGAFVAVAAARRESFPTRGALLVSAGVGGVLMIGLYGGFLYTGEQYTTGGYAAVLASTAPLLTVAVGFSLLATERLGPRGLLGMGIGFAGAVILVYPQLVGTNALGSWQGPVLILAAMVSTAIGTVLLRRFGRGRQGLWQIGAQFSVAGVLLGTASVVLPSSDHFPLTGGVLENLALLVGLSSLIGYFTYFALHHRVGPIRANLVAYLAPLVGVGVGTGLYGEPVTLWEILGVIVVLAGVSLVLWESARRTAAAPPPTAPR